MRWLGTFCLESLRWRQQGVGIKTATSFASRRGGWTKEGRSTAGALIIAFGRPLLNQYPWMGSGRDKIGGLPEWCSIDLTSRDGHARGETWDNPPVDREDGWMNRASLVIRILPSAGGLDRISVSPRAVRRIRSSLAWLAVATVALVHSFRVASCSADSAEPMVRWERAEQHMGATFTIVLCGRDQPTADAALDASFDRIRELDVILSNYKKASELNRLCLGSPHDEPQPVSVDLFRVLKRADLTSRQSDGAFDVTVGPLTRLWRQTRRTRVWPSNDRLQEAQAAVGYDAIRLDESRQAVQLLRPSMQLDLGGIGAGYALDEVADLLIRRGFENFMIDGSGDIRVSGSPPDRQAWRIAIGGLREGDPEEAYLMLRDKSVATSGDLHQYFEFEGQRYSHLIDSKTGVGLTVPSSVTVIAPDGITADVWSSTVALMGIERGMDCVLKHPEWGLEVRATWLEGNQRRSRETPGFAAYRDDSSASRESSNSPDEGKVRSNN